MPQNTADLNIKLDKDLIEQADSLFSELGMNMTTAFNIFLRQSVRQRKIPFEISLNTANIETIEAIKEIEDMKSGKLQSKTQSVKSLFEELEIDV